MKSYLITAIVENKCACAMALPNSKVTFVVEDFDAAKAGQQARRYLKKMTRGRVLAVEVDLARWEQ